MTELTFANTFSNSKPAFVFPALYTELKDAASFECPQQPHGFLTYQTIYSDQNFAQLFGVDGVVPPRAAVPTVPVLGEEPTDAELDTYKWQYEIFSEYRAAESRLKRALIKAIGTSAQLEIGHPEDGVMFMSIRQIVQALYDMYGTLSLQEIDFLHRQIVAPFTSAVLLDKEVCSRRRMYGLLADANQQIPEFLKVQQFMHSVGNLPGAPNVLFQYRLSHPETVQRTYNSIHFFFERHLIPPLRSGNAGAATAVLTVPSPTLSDLAFQASIDSLIASAMASAAAPVPKAKSKSKSKPATTHYCFVHGYQRSHSSTDCRVMASQPEVYSAAARNARSYG